MQRLKKISLVIFVIFVVFIIVKNPLVKSLVILGTKQVTGVKATIDKFSFGILSQSVQIKGFKLHNPKGFPKEPFIDISEISVKCNVFSIFKKKLHIKLLVLDLKEMVVVRNKEGKLNVDELKVSQQEKKSKAKETKKKRSKQMPMKIDEVRLNMGKVIVKDYSQGEPPSIQVYDIGVKDKVYRNLTSAEQLAALVMMEAMGPTTLKGAGIYGAATILGVGFLPAGVAGLMIGNDSGEEVFKLPYEKVYATVIAVVQKVGRLSQEDKTNGLIKAKVNGANIIINLDSSISGKVGVKISARKYMMPKPEIAKGILLQISEKLK